MTAADFRALGTRDVPRTRVPLADEAVMTQREKEHPSSPCAERVAHDTSHSQELTQVLDASVQKADPCSDKAISWEERARRLLGQMPMTGIPEALIRERRELLADCRPSEATPATYEVTDSGEKT